ncbi:MAG: copper resistance protein NlpE N-terminal domain-containing protein, partial [Rhodothermales bacterium]
MAHSRLFSVYRSRRSALLALTLMASWLGCNQPYRGDGLRETVSVSGESSMADSSSAFAGGFYSGVLPCASCPGIRTKIWFASDGSYRRAQIYLEGSDGLDRTVSDFGRWAVTPGDRIVLRSTDADVARFEAIHSGEIRLLDVEGRHIDSELNYNLKIDTTGQAEFGPMAMSGMYTYFADAAIFKPCNMRRTIPVAMIERHVDLEKLYLRQREAPGSPLLVRVNARLEDQPAMEGDAMTESLVVTSVE